MSEMLGKNRKVIIFIYLAALLCLVQYIGIWWSNGNQKAILVLKLPRSGSSWLTSQLNSFPDVYISKEIIQHSDCPVFNTEARQHHLKNAFISPTDKIRNSNSFLISGRFWEDFVLSRKWLSQLSVLGVTVNPEYTEDINWKEVLPQTSYKVNVVIFYRKNIIKSVISEITGNYVKKHCGAANIRKNGVELCKSPKSIFLNLTDFQHLLDRWEKRYRRFSNYVHEHFSTMPWKTIFLSYEELQDHQCKSLQAIMAFQFDEYASIALDSCENLIRGASWVKRGNDDLSTFILNFNELNLQLEKSGGCQVMLGLLLEKRPIDTVDAKYNALDRSFLGKVRECIEKLELMRYG